MLSVTAPYYTPPSNYQHSTLPRPVVSDPSDVVVQVRAASVNPIDVKKAAGMLKMLMNDECVSPFILPLHKLRIRKISVPDRVRLRRRGLGGRKQSRNSQGGRRSIRSGTGSFSWYGTNSYAQVARCREAHQPPGSWSEFVKCSDHYVTLKPTSLSFSDAASLPLAAVTGLQALRKYKGSLSGKTVFIPAGRKFES